MRSMVLALGLLACTSTPTTIGDPPPPTDDDPPTPPLDTVRWPDPDWATGTPASQGLDKAKLDEASVAASGNGSYCLLVIRHGVLVAEHYYNEATAATTPKSWSIAKSYTSTTTGIAIANGDLPPLDTRVADLVTEWTGSDKAAITIRDILRMTSGLHWSVFSDYVQMVSIARDQTDFAVGLDDDHAPNTEWTYNNGNVQIAEPMFRAATGDTIEAYARDHLWSKIGMSPSTTWAHDPAGHPTAYANVMATCRDHARLGYLMLHGGRWKSEQVVPAPWVSEALAPSQSFNRGYGLLWWLNGEGPTKTAMNKDKATEIYPYAPSDLFAARGFGGQFIDVIPSLDMVIVRFGKDPMSDMTPANAESMLIADENSDVHKVIVEPILAAVAP